MNRFAPLALLTLLAACDGFREAMTAHVEVVARAGSQELSVTRLAEMMGKAPQVPINKETARAVADVWVNYQLLGHAAAEGDSLNDPKKVDDAMWMRIAQVKTQKLATELSKRFAGDTNVTDATYAQGNLLSAQHILLKVPENATPAKADSIRLKAESVRAQATAANFAALAKKHSEDPGSKDNGGMYAAFPRGPAQGAMVPEFEKGVAALQPGQIGPLVRTAFGYHIIRRPTLAEVREPYGRAYAQFSGQSAESTYLAKMVETGKVQVKPKGPEIVRAVAKDLDAHRDDRSVIASSTAGNLTAGRVAEYIRAVPMPDQNQLRQSIAQVPDSLLQQFIKNMVQQELMIERADSAKIGPDSAELSQMRAAFGQMVQQAWMQLGVAPSMLADSAKSEAERKRVAGMRVEAFMDRLLAGGPFVVVQEPLERLLHEKYDAKVVDAGLERAVELATAMRQATDSTRAQQPQPPSAVPVPGQTPPPAPGGGAPPPGR